MQTHRQTDRQTHRQTDIKTHIQIQIQTYTQRHRQFKASHADRHRHNDDDDDHNSTLLKHFDFRRRTCYTADTTDSADTIPDTLAADKRQTDREARMQLTLVTLLTLLTVLTPYQTH